MFECDSPMCRTVLCKRVDWDLAPQTIQHHPGWDYSRVLREAVCVMYVDEKGLTPVTRFLDIVEVNNTGAKGLYQAIKGIFEENFIPPSNIIGYSSRRNLTRCWIFLKQDGCPWKATSPEFWSNGKPFDCISSHLWRMGKIPRTQLRVFWKAWATNLCLLSWSS